MQKTHPLRQPSYNNHTVINVEFIRLLAAGIDDFMNLAGLLIDVMCILWILDHSCRHIKSCSTAFQCGRCGDRKLILLSH